jgi:glutamate-5-semialdehyde dehydrogenase
MSITAEEVLNRQVETICQEAQQAAYELAATSQTKLNQALLTLAASLEQHTAQILEENLKDIATARANGQTTAFVERLTLNPQRVAAMSQGVREIAALNSRTGRILEERRLENGVQLQKMAVPLGVIGIIYESRPNVTVDTAALCLKSNNAVVLKGGSESIHSNRLLAKLCQAALAEAGLPIGAVGFIDSSDRQATYHLLKQAKYIDVLIPRGGYELVKAVVENSNIPVLYHAEGGARIYVDASADLELACQVIINSKTNRPSTCNTLDTVLLHRAIAAELLQTLLPQAKAAGVTVRADGETFKLVGPELADLIEPATEADWSTEYLNLIMSVKIVETASEALTFIRRYSKRHTEGIIATDQAVITSFISSIDAAALFVNCSTRLQDGWIFGLGAEMGISTGKLHARGPVGLEELSTYKWIALGNGQLRN